FARVSRTSALIANSLLTRSPRVDDLPAKVTSRILTMHLGSPTIGRHSSGEKVIRMRQALQVLVVAASLSLLAGCSAEISTSPTPNGADLQSVRTFLNHVQTSFNGGNFDEFMNVFTDDAIQITPGLPDTVGKEAIRKVYEGFLATNDAKVEFHTAEITV